MVPNSRDSEYPPSAVAGEIVWSGELRWHVGWTKPDGERVEEDGVGIAPPRVRVMLLNDGGWRLRVDDSLSRVTCMQVLRSLFNLSLSEASEATRLIPGEIYQGTHGEVSWLAEGLRARGVATRIVAP
jgi:hypothetical protein